MNMVLKIFLSMSVSGGLLILFLLLGKYFLQNKISRQWQYYIWLIVVLRLLLPFGPETNLMGKTYQAVDQAITQGVSSPQHKPIQNTPVQSTPGGFTPAVGTEPNNENVNSPTEDLIAAHPLQDIWTLFINHIWLVWLVVALGLLIRKMTIYQGFIRYINAGLIPVSDMEKLDQLSIVAEQTDVKKPIELCVNPMVSSPLLIGLFRPCIVLPSMDISEKDFQYIVLHELTHYKRRDMFYKWLVQITVCLHWFNPLVHLMSREITKACEFSCDEVVLTQMGYDNAQDYGKTLLDAMGAVGKYKENLGAVTLSENKQLLKERLGAIMNFKRKSAVIRLLTGILTLCVMFSAAFVGVYPVAAAADHSAGKPITTGNENSTHVETNTRSRDYAAQAERYYEADSLPLFQITFSRLDENTQKAWLERLYADGDFAFFSVAVRSLNADSPLLSSYAEKAYADSEIAFFSTLTDCMDKAQLELWLERALEDARWDFQSMLFDKLNMDDEKDVQEKAWAAQQMAEYQDAGITIDGKNYYYAGQLVNIFLDIRANNSCYTLDTNSLGTVNIKIIRDADDKITGVAYMTEAEVTELLNTNKTNTPSVTSDEQHTKTNAYPSSQRSDDWKDEFDWDDEKDKKWEETRKAEYLAADITVDGKNYYYQGQLVNIFMDIRANKSFYTLEMNPAGTVNIRITRGADDRITDVAYMTEAEVAELLGDMDDPDDTSDVTVIPVDFNTVVAGETIFLGEYTLSDGNKILYDISAKTGNRIKVFFAKDEQEDVVYWSVNNLRQPGEALECIADFIVGPPATKAGTYKLYLQAPDGALGNVEGSISIISTDLP